MRAMMVDRLLRLVALISLLLMPFGMTEAQAVAHHRGVSTSHCPGEADPDAGPAPGECAMFCAIVALETSAAALCPLPTLPALTALAASPSDRKPDVGTPPPKRP